MSTATLSARTWSIASRWITATWEWVDDWHGALQALAGFLAVYLAWAALNVAFEQTNLAAQQTMEAGRQTRAVVTQLEQALGVTRPALIAHMERQDKKFLMQLKNATDIAAIVLDERDSILVGGENVKVLSSPTRAQLIGGNEAVITSTATISTDQLFAELKSGESTIEFFHCVLYRSFSDADPRRWMSSHHFRYDASRDVVQHLSRGIAEVPGDISFCILPGA